MGTRADFYTLHEGTLAWLGSIAWDGFPDTIAQEFGSLADDELGYLTAIIKLHARDDWTSPEGGWPWPWDDSRTTDYAYVWRDGQLLYHVHENVWRSVADYDSGVTDELDNKKGLISDLPVLPDMSDRKNVTFGERSGLLVFAAD